MTLQVRDEDVNKALYDTPGEGEVTCWRGEERRGEEGERNDLGDLLTSDAADNFGVGSQRDVIFIFLRNGGCHSVPTVIYCDSRNSPPPASISKVAMKRLVRKAFGSRNTHFYLKGKREKC